MMVLQSKQTPDFFLPRLQDCGNLVIIISTAKWGQGNPSTYPHSVGTLSSVKFPAKLLSIVRSNVKRQVKPPSLQV